MATNIGVTIQKLANSSALQIQKLVNTANTQALQFNAKEAATAREFNSLEALKARQWQEEMSNTAHQREVADLKKAGLNPVLSANSGAQSYTTSSASAQNASGSVESGAGALSGIYGSLMSTMGGLEQTQMNNSAQMRIAQLQAEATRYASDNALYAAKYAADMSYKTQMDKPQTSIPGVIDKYFGSFGKSAINKLSSAISEVYKLNKKNGSVNVYDRNTRTAIDKGLNAIGYNQYYINNLSEKQRFNLRVNFGNFANNKTANVAKLFSNRSSKLLNTIYIK